MEMFALPPYSKYHAPGEIPFCGHNAPPPAPDEENASGDDATGNAVDGGEGPEQGPEGD